MVDNSLRETAQVDAPTIMPSPASASDPGSAEHHLKECRVCEGTGQMWVGCGAGGSVAALACGCGRKVAVDGKGLAFELAFATVIVVLAGSLGMAMVGLG